MEEIISAPAINIQSAYLVQTSSEIDDDFPGSVVVDDLKLTNVTCSRKDSVSLRHMKTPGCTHLHLWLFARATYKK